MNVSLCCGVPAIITDHFDMEEARICPKCMEHTEYVSEKELRELFEIDLQTKILIADENIQSNS